MHIGLADKRMILLIGLVLLVLTGMGNALMAEGAQTIAPGTTGIVASSSVLDVAAPPVLPASAVRAPAAQQQTDLQILQLDDAWQRADWNRCIEILTTLLVVDPANVEARERLFQAHVNLGWLQLSTQRFDDAQKQFTAALQIKPNGQEAMEGLRLLQLLVVCPVTPTPRPILVCTPTPCTIVVPTLCPAACPPGAVRIYVVQRGDNLFRIALRFNSSVALIMKANGLQTTTIKVGQRLVIP